MNEVFVLWITYSTTKADSQWSHEGCIYYVTFRMRMLGFHLSVIHDFFFMYIFHSEIFQAYMNADP